MNENYQEDVNSNSFFKAIKRTKLYALVEKNCWLVCVPQNSTASGLKITQELLESHILQPSPYFQGEYSTLNNKTVNIEDNIIKITLDSGEVRKAKILFEELFYNKDDKAFKVLCINIPLVGEIKINGAIKLPTTRNLQECIQFLYSSPVNRVVLSKINEQIVVFNKSYVLVKGFEQHAVDKAQAICTKTLEDLACANPDFRELYGNDTMVNELSLVVENYVLASLHSKLFSTICNLYSEEDALLLGRMMAWQKNGVNPTDFGLRAELAPFATAAIPPLQRIETCVTPIEKLWCIYDALNSATTAATSASAPSRTTSSPTSEPLTISADDSFPLLLYALVRARPKQLHSNLLYIERFIFANISTSSLGYHLANLQAATQFIRNGQLNPNTPTNTSPQSTYNNQAQDSYNGGSYPSLKRSTSDESLGFQTPPGDYSQAPAVNQASNYSSANYNSPIPRHHRFSYAFSSSNSETNLTAQNPLHTRPSSIMGNKSQSLLQLQPTHTTTTAPVQQQYTRPPTVIRPERTEDQFGDFLLQLKSIDDDTVSRRQFNSIWS